MSDQIRIDEEDILSRVGQVAAPGTSGTFEDYVGYLRATHQPCLLSQKGSQGWIPHLRGELTRMPMLGVDPPSEEEIRRALGGRGIWIVSYLRVLDEQHLANCFAYVCRERSYNMQTLHQTARNKVRRGLRSFTLRVCTPQEFAEQGFAAEIETAQRHGHSPPRPQAVRQFAESRQSPFHDIWGAWDGQNLAAWLSVLKIDDWAFIEAGGSRTEWLRLAPNNALRYIVARYYLGVENRSYVQSGVSSVQGAPNLRSLHDFKVKMGFQAVPLCRVFVPHPLLCPLLGLTVCSRLWDLLAGWRRESMILAKVAGLSRLLSGREEDPLAWSRSPAFPEKGEAP